MLFAIRLKERFAYDDSLDVVGIHMVGGIDGGILVGLFADDEPFVAKFEQAGIALLLNQMTSILVVCGYSFVATFVIAKVLDITIGLRVSDDAEVEGLDSTAHGETAYINDRTFSRA